MTASRTDLALADWAAHLVPRTWRRRVHARWLPDGDGTELRARDSGDQVGACVAVIVQDDDGTWVLYDGNEASRWETLQSAVIEAARPRDGDEFEAQLRRWRWARWTPLRWTVWAMTPWADTSPHHYADYLGVPPIDEQDDCLSATVTWHPSDLGVI